jgi:hypothetical protein
MKINGYKLRESMKRFELQRDAAEVRFPHSLYAFEGDKKDSADSIMKSLTEAEEGIANLQTVQAMYNLKVKVNVQGTLMTLTNAIKLMGGATRAENLWKVASGTKKTRGSYEIPPSMVRDANQTLAYATMTPKELLERVTKASAYAAALRSAIAQGNATEMDMDLDPKLLVEG